MTTQGVADARGIRLAYESFGEEGAPVVLLVMGLGTQMLGWPDDMCLELAEAGYRVVRFDNRDVGLSTHLDGLPTPSVMQVTLRRSRAPYTVDDMADDAAGLLDHLGVGSAHVVGASMGGFIAQSLAIRHSSRVRSLTLIMTTTGSRRVGRPKIAVAARLARPRRTAGREEAVEETVRTFKVIGSPGYPMEEERVREVAAASYDRAFDPRGFQRQLAACVAQPDRTARLRNVVAPTVVIHGLADPLIAPSGGLALARAIPRSHFVGLAGMGHDLPRPLLGRVTAEIIDVASRAGDLPVRS